MSKTRTDEEFLDLYCSCADVVFNNGENEVAFIKDKDFEFRYLSPEYRNKLLSPDGTVIIDNSAAPTDIQKHATEQALKQDQQIRETLKGKSFLYVDVYDRIGIIRKRPIINPATGNFVGIAGVIKPFALPNILSMIYKMNGINFGLANKVQKQPLKYDLTERQNMILFLYLNKYSNTEISEIMTILGHKISKTRVNDYLENLKYIFHVKTKEQLIEKAISLNYHLLIPRKFLKVGSYELEDEVIIPE